MNFFEKLKIVLRDPMIVIYHFLDLAKTYAQTGEDLIIKHHIGEKKLKEIGNNGTYIDIGANRPKHLNNTYLFYKMGWTGINIEPNKQLIKEFQRKRKNDINLNIAIGPKNGENYLSFYIMDVHTLSTTDKKTAQNYEKLGHRIVDEHQVEILSLETIFEKYINKNYVDILSIDVEGFDFEVLKSNNWDKFHAKYIILETLEYSNNRTGKKLNHIYDDYLGKLGYEKIGETYINTIYFLDI